MVSKENLKRVDCNGEMIEYVPNRDRVVRCCPYRLEELNGKTCEHLGDIIFIEDEARKKCVYKKG